MENWREKKMRGSHRTFYIVLIDILERQNREIKEEKIIEDLYEKIFQK